MRVIFATFALLVFLSSPALSQADSVFSDTQEYTLVDDHGLKTSLRKDHVLNLFLTAAHNRTYKDMRAWRYGMFPLHKIKGIENTDFGHPKKIKELYPWLYPYLYEAVPASNSLNIHKWNKPIRISFGYPNKFQPFSYKNTMAKNSIWTGSGETDFSEQIKIAEEQFSRMIPQLEPLTGLPIAYIPLERDDKNDPAELRIVFINNIGAGDKQFKEIPVELSGSGIGITTARIERMIPSYISFTPEGDHQVDGYYISNKDSEIGMAFCKIWIGHEPKLMGKLIRECLVRSLGLPGLTGTGYNSLLGDWNNQESLKNINKKYIPDMDAYELSDLDRLMISSLYDPKIKTNDTIETVIKKSGI